MFTKSIFATGVLLATSFAASAQAGQLTVEVNIPQQNVAEYHKPYMAGWIEDSAGQHVGNLFVWYDVKKRDGAGQKWLKELRTWWRKSGRDLTLPADGLTGPSRAPGRQVLTFDSAKTPLKSLGAGQYVLVVEAVREAGTHELVKTPFAWAPGKVANASAAGGGELGKVAIGYKP